MIVSADKDGLFTGAKMTRILFVCWGNICRSPMAEYLFRDMARRGGVDGRFLVASAGVSDEEEGNGVYPPVARLLAARGIDCSAKAARPLRVSDCGQFDLIVTMDRATAERTRRFFRGEADGKVKNLLDYAGRTGEEIADPWYTRDFTAAERDIEEGCRALLDALTGMLTLDFSACMKKDDLYAVMRERMRWQDWYGSNLDALWDILTGLEHEGETFRLVMPPENSPVYPYASLVRETFREAGKLVE